MVLTEVMSIHYTKFINEMLIGRFLAPSPEFCFVAEDPQDVSGYMFSPPRCHPVLREDCRVDSLLIDTPDIQP